MKYISLTLLFLLFSACKADEETLQVTSKIDCIIPPITEPEIHFANEDSITVMPIVQLR